MLSIPGNDAGALQHKQAACATYNRITHRPLRAPTLLRLYFIRFEKLLCESDKQGPMMCRR